jgi:hypothetical protein
VGLLTGWEGRWFDHQELKDDRCEAFTAYLAPGVYEYSYLTRATTLGVFIAPPPKVPPSLPAEEPSTLTWNPSHIRRTHPLFTSYVSRDHPRWRRCTRQRPLAVAPLMLCTSSDEYQHRW